MSKNVTEIFTFSTFTHDRQTCFASLHLFSLPDTYHCPLLKALRRLKLEVKTQKEETVLLRKALQDCEACKVDKIR